MPAVFNLKPTHRAVRGYYLALAQLANVGAKHETAVREAFSQLAFGHKGGGVEVIFTRGTTAGTVKGQAQIPPG